MSKPKIQQDGDLELLLAVLPTTVFQRIKEIGNEHELLEIVLDLGRQPAARYLQGEQMLRETEVSQEELDHLVNNIGQLDDDNRAGIARTLHRISAIRNRRGKVVGVTCRVGRAVYGTIDIIEDIVREGKSILLLGRPGVGKTTMLREMARVISESRRVVIVDTSNEIGGDGDIPHPAVGRARRMQVPRSSLQHETMIEAVENHNPEVIVIDEIGREQEATAARTINERGVQLIGTAHGNTLENLMLNPTLSDLIGGIESVTLSDEEARRRGTQKTVLERRAPPTFDMLIEIQERERLQIHTNVAASVDAMLRGQKHELELRYTDEAGHLHKEKTQTVVAESLTGRRTTGASQPRIVGGREPRELAAKVDAHKVIGKEAGRETAVVNLKNMTAKKIFAYGIARNRLRQAAQKLGLRVVMTDDVEAADVLVTLKSYYRQRPQIVNEAQKNKLPVYVLRANTSRQIERFLIELFRLQEGPIDPFERAVADVEEGINLILRGEDSVNLRPTPSAMRRYQHEMAQQANFVSHSYGKEPNRYVRIFNTPRR